MSNDYGFDDFVDSRDIHGNNALHYIALMDDEEFLEVIINKINWQPYTIPILHRLSEA